MNTFKKFLIALIFAASIFTFLPGQPVQAQIGICDIIGPICDAIGISTVADDKIGITAENFLTSRLTLILGLMFVGITLLAIFIIIQAGIKYMQSQGNEEQIGDAQKSIKSVFLGLAVLIVGVVGVIIVIVFLGGGSGFFGLNENEACFNDCIDAGHARAQCITACQDGDFTEL